METALVFDKHGIPLHWHAPEDRSRAYLPDSRPLWDVLWENRDRLGGVAHTHPWHGHSGPSSVDITTYAAIEAALGARLVWPIVTFSMVGYWKWKGPGELDYADMFYEEAARDLLLRHEDIAKLRDLSR